MDSAGSHPLAPPRPSDRLSSQHASILFAFGALGLILLFGAAFNADGTFFTAYTHSSTLGQLAPFLILACGMTVVILTGGIDLSVGSLVALAAVVTAKTAVHHHWSAPAAIGAGIASATVCGILSGTAIAYLRLQPFVATLAMMAFARGVAKWLTNNAKVGMNDPPRLIEALDGRIRLAEMFDLPLDLAPALACFLAVLLLLRLTPTGVAIYATGDNEQAARYAGVPIQRTKLLAYTLSGALAGLAGVIVAAREHQGNPDGAVGYELTAIAMVVVGGTSLSGGRGGVVLTALGALTIGYLQKILDINGFETYKQLMITGAIIALAVLVQGFRRR
jgi:ribose transport system permease protein